MEQWKLKVRQLKRETHAIYLACKDPRVSWSAKVLAACVVGYAFSPIDLIPDFIPVLGYLDDLVLVPLGISLVLRMIPPPVMAECREKARDIAEKPTNWIAAGVIVAVWIVSALLFGMFLLRILGKR